MKVTYETRENRIEAFCEAFADTDQVDEVIRALQFFRRHMAAEIKRRKAGKPRPEPVKFAKKLEEAS